MHDNLVVSLFHISFSNANLFFFDMLSFLYFEGCILCTLVINYSITFFRRRGIFVRHYLAFLRAYPHLQAFVILLAIRL